ncbi:MAG: hypothetical protein KH431_02090 [Erysipelotrichaceae bacterium]|nr:hypothetical protein [Erysipelotrichaceae bacterium]
MKNHLKKVISVFLIIGLIYTSAPITNVKATSSSSPLIQTTQEAQQAIKASLDSYQPVNTTSSQDIKSFLTKELIDTQKLSVFYITTFDKTDATVKADGSILLTIEYKIQYEASFSSYTSTLVIDRLSDTEKAAVTVENFPDDFFRKYLSDQYDKTGTGFITINEVTDINIQNQSLIKNLKGIELFKNLKTLNCSGTGITVLNTSKNTVLETLECDHTNISALDVSQNHYLTKLNCDNTNIQSLDLSKNTNLNTVNCSYTPLAWLNFGGNFIRNVTIQDSSIDMNVSGNSFNMKDAFAGINLDKVHIISGAELNPATGMVTKYKIGTPIIYEYDIDIVDSLKNSLQVTLNLHMIENNASTTQLTPATGDTSHLFIFNRLLFISAGVLLFSVYKNRKIRRNNTDQK